jgi:hypothetical protein
VANLTGEPLFLGESYLSHGINVTLYSYFLGSWTMKPPDSIPENAAAIIGSRCHVNIKGVVGRFSYFQAQKMVITLHFHNPMVGLPTFDFEASDLFSTSVETKPSILSKV